MKSVDRILWVDCIGGLVVGCVVLALRQPLSEWENLPLWVVVSMGVANLLYGGYSLYTTTRSPRPIILVQILAIANMFWLCVCIAIVVTNWQEVAILGILHVIGEGLYVALLGYTEWKWQNALSLTPSQIV